MGSVKSITVIREPRKNRVGVGLLSWSKAYSISDYGEMPDHPEHLDTARCLTAAIVFEEASKRGIKNHYHGLVSHESKEPFQIKDMTEPVNTMVIDLVNVIKPKFSDGIYDYSAFVKRPICVIPAELIFRYEILSEGSAAERLKTGEAMPEHFGLKHYPELGEKFFPPLLDVSTKYEERDVYLSWSEAQAKAGLTNNELYGAWRMIYDSASLISDIFNPLGLYVGDGKIETARYPDGSIVLVDGISLDELRVLLNGTTLGKQFPRDYYEGTPWKNELKIAKKKADELRIKNWRRLCKLEPENMSAEASEVFSQEYMSPVNDMIRPIIGWKPYDAPPLYEVVKHHNEILQERRARLVA